uniref:Uncharacterized protein n=1 Tax=Elaeophora elaphi TaxID=1147741 RepID=A0A0R3S4R1_9BILA
MSTSSNSLTSSTREFAYPRETPHQHECIEMLMPEHVTNSLVISTVLEEMPLQARTTDRPVILTHATNSNIMQHSETITSEKT